MRVISGAELVAAAPMPELLDAVEAAYRDVAAGRDRSPLRSRIALEHGDLLLMPGIRDGGRGSTLKLVTWMPANAERGLPTIHAVVVWLDAVTGAPLALLDGSTLTAMRTGAASGVGARLMARPDASVLTVLGAGAQAPWQVRAVCAARPIREVRIYARTPAARDALAAELADELGDAIRVAAPESSEEAVRGADVICCVTTSSQPVLDAAWLTPGAHVNAIGSYRLDMIEVPPAAFGAAMLVAVDQRRAALAEAGDLVAAIGAGLVAEERLVEIGELPPDWAARRGSEAITVFKSVGLAIQDVAAAELVVGRLELGSEPRT